MFGSLVIRFEQLLSSVDIEGLWDLHVVQVVNVLPGLGFLFFHKMMFGLVGDVIVQNRMGKNGLILMNVALVLVQSVFSVLRSLWWLLHTVWTRLQVHFPLIPFLMDILLSTFEWMSLETNWLISDAVQFENPVLIFWRTVNVNLWNLVKLLARTVWTRVSDEFLLKSR